MRVTLITEAYNITDGQSTSALRRTIGFIDRYLNAQQLIRDGSPIRFEPKARVYHELPSVKKERFRRGYDHIASSWVDPLIGSTPLLELSESEVLQRFYNKQLDLAHKRHQIYCKLVQLDEDIHAEIGRLLPRLVALERFGCAKPTGKVPQLVKPKRHSPRIAKPVP